MPTTLEYTLTPEEMMRAATWHARQKRTRWSWTHWLANVIRVVAPFFAWWIGMEYWVVALLSLFTISNLFADRWITLLFSRIAPKAHFHVDITPQELLVDCKSGRNGKHDIHFTIPCERLAATGSVDESEDFLILQYPTRNGRTPSRGVLIPKRAFESEAELTTFRDWLRTVMSSDGDASLSPV